MKFNLEQISRYRYALGLLLFGLLVIGKFHGSSLSLWDQWLSPKTHGPILGVARPIRSDEYRFQTPTFFSQTQISPTAPLFNPNLRSQGENMLINLFSPVWHLASLGKPINWGFLLLGPELGLSWYWWAKAILLFLFSYELSLIFTSKNRGLALLGAFWITYSPFVQWSFSTAFVDLIMYFEGICICTYHWLQPATFRKRSWLTLALTSLTIGFTVTLYPTFQITLGYFLLFWVGFWIYEDRRTIVVTKKELTVLSIGALIAIISVGSFLWSGLEPLRIAGQTAYPGKQSIHIWDYGVSFLQLYLFNWRVPFKGTEILNECEVSTFINFLPAVVLTAPFLFKRMLSLHKLMGYLLGYTLFLITWLFLAYPSWIAKITLFSFLSTTRLHLLVSLFGVYATLWAASQLVTSHRLNRKAVSLILCFVALIYLVSLTNPLLRLGIGKKEIIFSLIAFLVINWALLTGRIKSFALGILAVSILPALAVNPFDRGTGAIFEKDISKKIQRILQSDPEGKWVGLNEKHPPVLLMALGAKVFNGPQWYPDLPMWKKLDDAEKYKEIYNRYAFVDCDLTPSPTSFTLEARDNFTVHLHPSDLSKAGIKYLLSYGKINPLPELSINEIDSVLADNLFIYKTSSLSAE